MKAWVIIALLCQLPRVEHVVEVLAGVANRDLPLVIEV